MSEEIIIPDLPPESADFNSFISDVIDLDGDGTPSDELAPRLAARGGYARNPLNTAGIAYKESRSDAIRYFSEAYGNGSIREERQVTTEQAEVVQGVASRIDAFKTSEARLIDTASFLQDILADKIPSDELAPRLAARGGYARNPLNTAGIAYKESRSDAIRYFSEAYGNGSIREERQVTTEQAEVVQGVASRIDAFKTSEARLIDTASFLQDILADKIPSDELAPRLAARGGYARNPLNTAGIAYKESRSDAIRYFSEAYGNESIREERQVTTEQAEVVRFIASSAQERAAKATANQAGSFAVDVMQASTSIEDVVTKARKLGIDDSVIVDLQTLYALKGSTVEDGVDDIVVEYLQTGDDEQLLKLLDDRRMRSADISDASFMAADLRSIETYVQTARRIGIKSRFWQSFQGGLNPDTGLRLLEEYETLDDQDIALVRELQGDALRARRDGFIVEAVRQLGGEQTDYIAVSIFLGGAAAAINTLQDQQAEEILRGIVDTAYQSEVNAFFGNLVSGLGLDRAKITSALEALESAPVRPAIAGVDFFEKFEVAKKDFTFITDSLSAFVLEQELIDLKKRFLGSPDVAGLVEEVLQIPGDTEEDSVLRQSLLDELALYVAAQRGLNPGRFIALKEVVVDGVRSKKTSAKVEIDLTERDIEKRALAAGNLVGRFKKSIMPLFETLRGRRVGNKMTEKYVSGRRGDRADFVQRSEALESQRELSEIERAYLESVKLMTVFNPHLVALAKEAPELTSLYLETYFQSIDQRTKEQLVPDIYVPHVQIGLGPNGLAAAGELNRCNPELAAQTLYIEGAAQPGGPFAVARGLSWELNSANSFSRTTNVLPDVIEADAEGVSVRSLGSPLVGYPGERSSGLDVRQSSINVTVDYLPNPDNVSSKRYPTNVDLARVLQMQASMLVDSALFSTRLVSVESVDDGNPGNKRLTVEYTSQAGETITTTIRTDSLVVASGLGEPSFGINLEGSKAAEILAQSSETQDGFPLLTDTIGAFEALSSPEGDPVTPQGTIVIYGGGNSADVLIEYLGRQFESGNTALNGITKVVVVTNAELSKRPRYAQINDLKARNGKANFLEIVDARVADVEQLPDGSIQVLDETGQPITAGVNGSRGPIRADHVIAATGFKPQLDEIFETLLSDGESLDRRSGLSRVSLPSNPSVSVGNELASDPSVIFVGTASDPNFNASKLAQLPDQAREALLRNGAENAVAIGFRTPDTRAAIRLKLSGREVIAPSQLGTESQIIGLEVGQSASREGLQKPINVDLPQIRRDVSTDSDTLTALFLQSLPQIRLTKSRFPITAEDPSASFNVTFGVKFDEQAGSLSVDSSDLNIPDGLLDQVMQAVSNSYFQAYALAALAERRDPGGIVVSLAFDRGRLVFSDKGKDSTKGRTFVEAV